MISDGADFADDSPAEFYFRNRVKAILEQFFRAGWEARGMVESEERLKQMTGQ
jgi:hypothetical protein